MARTVEQVAIHQLDALREIVARRDVSSVYGTFTEYLSDFYPDFSWDARIIDEINHMKTLPDYDNVMDGLMEIFKFDMRAHLDEAIALNAE